MRAMKSMEISLGQTASHSPYIVQLPKCSSIDFHHADHALVALGLALRQEAEVGDFGGGEELRGAVRALRDARAALDAFGGVHRRSCTALGIEQRVGLDRAAGVDGDVAPSLDDLVERTAVDDEVLDDRERACAPRLDADCLAVLK